MKNKWVAMKWKGKWYVTDGVSPERVNSERAAKDLADRKNGK